MNHLNLDSLGSVIGCFESKHLLYDVKKDQMVITYKDENAEDKQLVLEHYIDQFDFEIIHPADAELLIDALKGLLVSPKDEILDIRSKRFQDNYEWYKLILRSKADQEGHVVRFEGEILNLSEENLNDSIISDGLSKDTLTKIYNQRKMSQEIDGFLKEESQTQRTHAMFLLDLDNFGMVNTCLGQDVGDQVLQECANVLMQNFRRLDIVGRIGSDEFALFYKDAKSLFNIELLAEKLVKKLQWDLPYEDKLIHVSGSIGISVVPYHGSTCEELVMKAKDALLTAKASGKNGYHIFDSANTRLLFAKEDDEKCSFSRDKSMEEMVIEMISNGKKRNVALRAAMEIMLLNLNWHRGWILPSTKNLDLGMVPLFSCKEGYESGVFTKEESMRRISIWERLFEEKKDFSVLCEYDTNDEELRRYMIERKIYKIIYYPFSINGNYEGCIVLEECTDRMQEPEDDNLLEQLKTCCRMIDTCTIQFNKDIYNIKDIITKIQLLDNMDSYVYLVDLDDLTIKYVNRKVRFEYPQLKLGELCYPLVFSDKENCEEFLYEQMDSKDIHANGSQVLFNSMLRTWIKQSVCWFEYKSEHRVVMIIDMDISEYFIG